MNVIEKEAKQFSKRLYQGTKVNNLENLNSAIGGKLYNFSRDKDKLDFLRILRAEIENEKIEHARSCKGNGCHFEEDRDMGIFVIDQEIESINKFYKFDPIDKDKFSAKEEAQLQSRLNQIIEKLEHLGIGQEIIFDEIESLKNHFNVGKKNWFQLLKGKLIDLTAEKVLERTIVAMIYDTLAESFTEVKKMIE